MERGVSFGFVALKCGECGELITAPGDDTALAVTRGASSRVRVRALTARAQPMSGYRDAAKPVQSGIEVSLRRNTLQRTLGFFGVVVAFGGALGVLGDYLFGTNRNHPMPEAIFPILVFAAFGYAALHLAVNRFRIRVADGTLRIAYGPLPWPSSKVVEVSSMGELEYKAIPSENGKLCALGVTSSGRELVLTSSIAADADTDLAIQIVNAHLERVRRGC